MSFLTVPPPFDDDHEDVAWALRAASAQWKREAHQDAIHWVRRASETAKELGAAGRASELSRLAQALTNASMPAVSPPPPPITVAPPPIAVAPPPIAVAPPPWATAASHHPSGPASVDYEIVDVDVELDDEDEVEELDDNDEIELLDDEGVEAIDELEDVAAHSHQPASIYDQVSAAAQSLPAPAAFSASFAAESTIHGYRPVPPPSLPPGLPSANSLLKTNPLVATNVDARRESSRPRRSSSEPAPYSTRSTPPSSMSAPAPSFPLASSFPPAEPVSEPVPKSERPSKRRNSSRAPAARPQSARPTATGTRRQTTLTNPNETFVEAPQEPRRAAERSRAGRTTTSPKLDRLPPSMRPVPSGLDLDEDAENELELNGLPVQFAEEAQTNRLERDRLPSIPDLGPISLEGSPILPIEDQTAAEYAQMRASVQHDHDELERELGVDLSIRRVDHRSPVPAFEREEENLEAHRISNYPSSFPGGIVSGLPSSHGFDLEPQIPELEVSVPSPIPGRASSRPSAASVSSTPRTTSAPVEPYALAPSAAMPAVLTTGPRIEPPSRPTHAPPPSSMAEPDLGHGRPSPPAVVGLNYSDIAPTSAAPDPDEFEELFAKISVPPVARAEYIAPISQEAPGFDPDFDDVGSDGPRSVPAQPILGTDGGVLVDGLDLMEVDGFQDLPEDSALELAKRAQLRTLLVREEVSGFGLAIVTFGAVSLMPFAVDATCRIARKGEVIFTQGTLPDAPTVRVVGLEEGSRVAVFSRSDLDAAVSSCPWVADELSEIADNYLAFAGAVLGPLGRSLDEMFRFMVLEKCIVKRKAPGDLIATGGKSMDGMYILGGGSLEVLADDGKVMTQIVPGEFVFPDTVFSAAPAEHTVRAGKEGALVLYATRMAAHELLATCPPFIELLAR